MSHRRLCRWNPWIVLLICSLGTFATSDWFGDLRAYMDPSRSAAFYDIIYDDFDYCPHGMESDVIPDYAYFGPMITTMNAKEYSECIQQCIITPKCTAINYFKPLTTQEHGFCEILSESQIDNPQLLRPFKEASYYENIKCLHNNDGTKPWKNKKNQSINTEPQSGISNGNKAKIISLLKSLAAKIREFNERNL